MKKWSKRLWLIASLIPAIFIIFIDLAWAALKGGMDDEPTFWWK